MTQVLAISVAALVLATGAALTEAHAQSTLLPAPAASVRSATQVGAGSLSESEAHARIQASGGYTWVSGLSKDERGTWSGNAITKDRKPVRVSVDTAGTVTVK